MDRSEIKAMHLLADTKLREGDKEFALWILHKLELTTLLQ